MMEAVRVTLEVKESEEGGWGGWSGRNDEASSSNGDEDASSLLPIGSTSKTRPFGGRRGELSKDLPRTLASLSSHLAARRAEADRSLGGEKHASRTKETTEEDAMAHPVLSQISGGGKERKAPVASPAHPAPRAWTPASSLSPAAQSRVPLPVPLPTLESVSSAPQAPAAAEVSRGPQEAALPLKHSNEAFARQAGHPSVPSSHLHLQSNSGGTCYPLSTSAEDHTYRYDNHEVHFVPGGTTIGAKPQDVLSVEFGSKEQDRAKFFRVLYRARETGEKRWSVWLVGHQKEKEEHHETHKYVEVKEINSDVVDGKAEPPIHKMDLAQHEEECESGEGGLSRFIRWLFGIRRVQWVDMVEYYFVDSNGKWQKGQPVEGWIQNRPKVFSVVEERLYTMQFGTPCPEVGSDEETDEGPLTESADS
uniref:Uncharacterized protein n=1 Tax=Chromera velia CCMP2878 TaxID=1169474 RepID=A0A0G4H9S8_9ALVE|eukprot:Cvel_6031.t1-p1 / transcript=Cvel_6031.t1 / gene=Cvel_6031 / organism=Chromera_velia_CCMP2878 / gene_product=hypothetical protein / transcript_product=hypothetical protein / location=Cvel_scaffold289:61020-72389(-) / protein_length=420 / sequence_SO=supercontig / SO=protein_coding / is_pseudo=false